MKHWRVIQYKYTTCSLHRYCSYSFILQFTVATPARSIHQISFSLIISPIVEIQGTNVIESKQGIRLSSLNNWCPPDRIIFSEQQVCYSQKSNHNTVLSVVSTTLGPSIAIGLGCTGGWTLYQKSLLCSHLRLIHAPVGSHDDLETQLSPCTDLFSPKLDIRWYNAASGLASLGQCGNEQILLVDWSYSQATVQVKL